MNTNLINMVKALLAQSVPVVHSNKHLRPYPKPVNQKTVWKRRRASGNIRG